MNLTPEQEKIFQKVQDKLEPLVTETSKNCYYVTVSYSDTESEQYYDYICGDDACCDKLQKIIAAEYGEDATFDLSIDWSDKDRIERCIGCGAPLNDAMTWISDEINALYENTENLSDVLLYAFDLKVVFNSMPSSDHSFSEYDKTTAERYAEAVQRQSNFVQFVYDFARKIIGIIDSGRIMQSK